MRVLKRSEKIQRRVLMIIILMTLLLCLPGCGAKVSDNEDILTQ